MAIAGLEMAMTKSEVTDQAKSTDMQQAVEASTGSSVLDLYCQHGSEMDQIVTHHRVL